MAEQHAPPAIQATVDTRGWSVDQLIAFSRDNPHEIVDVLHLSVMELVKFRYADPNYTPSTIKDNAVLTIFCKDGAMRGTMLAGFAENIREHDLERVIDNGIGSSVGMVAVTGIASRNPSAGANAQRYLADKGGNKKDHYIQPVTNALSGKPVLQEEILKTELDTRAPLDQPFAFPVHAMVSELKDGEFQPVMIPLTDSQEQRQWARFISMYVPIFMGVHKDSDKPAYYDGAGATDVPYKQARQQLGTTHMWVLDTAPLKEKEQKNISTTLQDKLMPHLEKSLMTISQVMGRYGFKNMEIISAWAKRNERLRTEPDTCGLTTHRTALDYQGKDLGLIETDRKKLAEYRVAAYEHMAQELEREIGIETHYHPQGWGAEIYEDLGLDHAKTNIDIAAIHEKVLNAAQPAFDPTNHTHRNNTNNLAQTEQATRGHVLSAPPRWNLKTSEKTEADQTDDFTLTI